MSGARRSVSYTHLNTSVALINDQGLITGVGAGSTTLTVTAKNGVRNQIDLEVYSPVTGILIDTSELSLQIDQTFQIHAMVLPYDANEKRITYQSEDPTIAEVTQDGTIRAVNTGKTAIIATTVEGNQQARVNVTVVRKIQEDELQFDNSLTISGNEISGLDDKDTSVTNLISKIYTNLEVQVYNLSLIHI